MRKRSEGINIKELLGIFLGKIWIILAVALLFALVVGIFSAFVMPDEYSCDSMIMVTRESNLTVSDSDLDLTSRMVETYKYVITTDDFLSVVIGSIQSYVDTPEFESYKSWAKDLKTYEIRKSISIAQQGETELFNVKVTTQDPKKSYIIADVLSHEIEDKLASFLSYEEKDISSQIVNTAKRTGNPNGKNEWRNSIIGFIIGAVLSMVCVFLFSLFDVVIHDRKKLEDHFDIPIIGVIPRIDNPTVNHDAGGKK